MANYQPVSRRLFASKRWIPVADYRFAARFASISLVAEEFAKACLSLPIAFVSKGAVFSPVAVLGLFRDQNLFVAPKGHWVMGYIPARLRAYPFALAKTGAGQTALCVDMESGLVSDTEGKPFLDAQGEPDAALRRIAELLNKLRASEEVTTRACAVLQAHGLIKPWAIRLENEQGAEPVHGLHCIDEAALNALSPEALAEVRQVGGLPLAYCQLLSMQHVSTLGKLAELHRKAVAPLPTNQSGEIDLEFLNDGGTIRLGGDL